MLIVPTIAQPSQRLTVRLGSQACTIDVRQLSTGMFLDLYVNNALVLAGALCLNGVRIVRDAYLGFVGDLVFADTQGTDDPQYPGLGSRWLLGYLEEGE